MSIRFCSRCNKIFDAHESYCLCLRCQAVDELERLTTAKYKCEDIYIGEIKGYEDKIARLTEFINESS